ncbi:MAG: HEAT repeat domain-containing protein, partial [Ardenticatenaceae bacterium]
QTIQALITSLGDEDQLVIEAAMKSLMTFGHEVASNLRTALSTPDLGVRWSAAEMLVNYPSAESEKALRLALRDDSPHVQGASARSLRNMVRDQETVEALVELLDHAQPFPRYQALRTLRAHDPSLVDEAQILRQDLQSANPADRSAALDYIREHRKMNWIREVEQLLNDSNRGVRRAAEWALERLHSTTG